MTDNQLIMIKTWLISIAFCFSFGTIKAQSSNVLVLDSLVKGYAESLERPVDTLIGFVSPHWRTWFPLNSEADQKITFSEPLIRFTKENKDSYVRVISISIENSDSISISRELMYSDTLTKAQLKTVRKSSPKGLKGNSPLIFNKVFMPVIGITIGISFIVSLFYLRS